jgi:hypothetical protein
VSPSLFFFHLGGHSITKAMSMYFWSVSWSTNCPVYFSFFLVDQNKIVQSQRPDKKVLVSLWFFLVGLWFFCSLSNKETDQKNTEIDQNFLSSRWDWTILIGWSKKYRNRPDNRRQTKRLDKNYMDSAQVEKMKGVKKSLFLVDKNRHFLTPFSI